MKIYIFVKLCFQIVQSESDPESSDADDWKSLKSFGYSYDVQPYLTTVKYEELKII